MHLLGALRHQSILRVSDSCMTSLTGRRAPYHLLLLRLVELGAAGEGHLAVGDGAVRLAPLDDRQSDGQHLAKGTRQEEEEALLILPPSKSKSTFSSSFSS